MTEKRSGIGLCILETVKLEQTGTQIAHTHVFIESKQTARIDCLQWKKMS